MCTSTSEEHKDDFSHINRFMSESKTSALTTVPPQLSLLEDTQKLGSLSCCFSCCPQKGDRIFI